MCSYLQKYLRLTLRSLHEFTTPPAVAVKTRVLTVSLAVLLIRDDHLVCYMQVFNQPSLAMVGLHNTQIDAHGRLSVCLYYGELVLSNCLLSSPLLDLFVPVLPDIPSTGYSVQV